MTFDLDLVSVVQVPGGALVQFANAVMSHREDGSVEAIVLDAQVPDEDCHPDVRYARTPSYVTCLRREDQWEAFEKMYSMLRHVAAAIGLPIITAERTPRGTGGPVDSAGSSPVSSTPTT